MSDEEAARLWQAFCQGGNPVSADALGRLYEAYLPEVFRYCRALLRDEQRASELAQQVFVRILQSRNRPALRSTVKALVLCVARNLCLTDLAHPALILGLNAFDSKVEPQEDYALVREEEFDTLEECMARLPELERSIVALHHGEGLPYREIQDILGLEVSASWFTRHLTKAMDVLRRCLKEKGLS